MSDNVNAPQHYVVLIKSKTYPYSTYKVECLDVIDSLQMNLNIGSSFQYLWRAGRKDPGKKLEDLKKARFYLDREIKLMEGEMDDDVPF